MGQKHVTSVVVLLRDMIWQSVPNVGGLVHFPHNRYVFVGVTCALASVYSNPPGTCYGKFTGILPLYTTFTGLNPVTFPKQGQKSSNIALHGKGGGANIHGGAFQTVTPLPSRAATTLKT